MKHMIFCEPHEEVRAQDYAKRLALAFADGDMVLDKHNKVSVLVLDIGQSFKFDAGHGLFIRVDQVSY